MFYPDQFGHLFATLLHINFAGAALISFFYTNLYNSLVEEHRKSTVEVGAVRQALRHKFTDVYKPSNAAENLWNAIKWFFAEVYMFISKPFAWLTNRKLQRLNTEEDYLKKYLPLFFYSGLVCLIMLYYSGIVTEHCPKIVQAHCYFKMLYILLSSYTFILVYLFFLYKIRTWKKSFFANIFTLIIVYILCYFTFDFMYGYFASFYNSWLLHWLNQFHSILPWLIFILSAFPFVYVILKAFLFQSCLLVVKGAYVISNKYGNDDMGENLP